MSTKRTMLIRSPWPKDGRTNHALYKTWRGMLHRCYNPKRDRYYGGHGVTVCDRWKFDFWLFVSDMGDRPDGHTIDRIDPNGAYEPSNCRWANPQLQSANKKLHKKNSTGFKGVVRHKSGRFAASISINSKRRHIGLFLSAIEAAEAYDRQSVELRGSAVANNRSLGLLP